MPAPTTYTEYELAAFMARRLGAVAVALGWAAESPELREAVWDALGDLGLDAIADATDARALRAAGLLAAIRAARREAAAFTDAAVEGMTFTRSQLFDHLSTLQADAEREAAALGLGPLAVVVGRVSYAADPFADRVDEWAVV